ncbi:MAG: ABC transporter permease [Blastocatellia bacterium]|nr:ABC transporter permease [Blastocatellia bacterium]
MLFNRSSQLWRRLLFYLRRDRFDRELEEEMRFHLEMKAEENLAAGILADEAQYAAQRQFGNQTLHQEASRDMWSFRFLEMLAQDIRFSLRIMKRNPGFTAVAVLTLTLGIGACTAVFSVVYAAMLKPLPYRDPNRLCLLWKSVPKKGLERDWTSYPSFRDWRDNNHVFEDMALYFRPEAALVTLNKGDQTELAQAAVVSANFFMVMGIAPLIGRTFTPKDGEPGEDLAVLSYGYWQQRFGGSPDVLGKSISFDKRSAQIIGVMREGFQFPFKEAPFWLLNTADPRWKGPYWPNWRVPDAFAAVGRLKPQISVTEAQADMNRVASNLAQQYPETDAGLGISVVPLELYVTGSNLRRAFWLLLAAVTLVLLISCANVASLLLSRGFARQSEYAIRAALGAGRIALLKQLLTESIVLFLIAGALGTVMAASIIKVLQALAPANIPRLEEAGISWEVLAFSLALSVVTAVTFGMAPAWKILRNDPQEFLKQGGRTDAGPGRRRIRELLVTLECALLVILLVVTGLLLRSFLKLQDANLGFRPDHLISVNIHLPGEKYGTGDSTLLFIREAVERIEALPGVESASIGGIFIGDHLPNYDLLVEGNTGLRKESVAVVADSVSDNYFQTMGIPLLRGRNFSEQDPPGVVINEMMAQRLWPGEDPIGKRFGRNLPGMSISLDTTVIGVVGNVLRNGRESDAVPAYYGPVKRLAWWYDRRLVVRTAADPTTLVAPIRDVIRSMDKTIPKYEVTTVEDELYHLDAQRRFQLQTLSPFSLIALILAAVGIYSVLSYLVEQRTREIGLKLALGAQPQDVVRSVLVQGMKPVLAGLGIGLIGALAGASMMKSLLYHVPVTDPTTFAVIAAVLVMVALLAAYLPARRATKVDPMTALRSE